MAPPNKKTVKRKTVKRKTVKNNCIKNLNTNRCKTSNISDETSKYCYMNKNTKRCKLYSKELLEIKKSGEYTFTTKAYNYLDKLILKKTPSEITKMRKIHLDNKLDIPLNDYKTDNELKEYMFNEICDLATYYSRDADSHDVITVKSINYVIKNDDDLSVLLNKVYKHKLD
jgi:hypothetical protein